MVREDQLARSKAVAAEWEKLNAQLRQAVTFRMLYFTAYNYLSMCVQDQLLGVRSVAQLQQSYAMLCEALVTHAARVKEVTAVAPPRSAPPRLSELER